MSEKEVEEIEKEAIKWVQNVFPNDEFKQSGISRALVEFAELGYNKANEPLIKAKELLTRFIMGGVYFNGKETDLVEEAEQFLRELEE